MCHSYYVVIGMVGTGILAGLIKSFEDTYSLSHMQMGTLMSVGAILGAVASLVAGFLFDRYGARSVLLWAMALTAFSAFGILAASVTSIFVVALLSFRFSQGLGIVVNPLVGHLYYKERSRGMNLLHGFLGVGKLLAPMVVLMCIWVSGQWKLAFMISGILFGLEFLVFFFAMKDPAGLHTPSSSESLTLHQVTRSLLDFRMLLGMMGFVFLIACETSIFIWIPNFLETEAGFPKATALFALSLIAAGYMSIRMFFGLGRGSMSRRFVLITIFLHLASFWLIINVHNNIVLLVFSFLLGVSFGTYWPSLAAIIYDYAPSGTHGAVTSLFVIFSNLGAILSGLLVGWLGDIFSLRQALVLAPIGAIIYVIIYSIFFFLTRNKPFCRSVAQK